MMQKFIKMLFVVLLCTKIYAEAPADYYNSANGLTGDALKAELHNIIKEGHVRFPYTSSSTDVWDLLQVTDEDPDNPDNVILIYTGRSQPKTSYGGNVDDWNREHIWAKSHGFPNSGDYGYTDIHHLRPSDVTVNSARGNKDFDNGGTANSEATECFTDTDSWEPRDAVKGDVARMMFYMATRYEGDGGSNDDYDLVLVDYTGTENCEFGKLSTLLEWHNHDPVDDFERNRNDKIFSFQKNRNPFIDHPEYVAKIWGGDHETIAPEITITAPVNNFSTYPNSQLNVTATASDSDGNVTNVKFYLDNTLLGSDFTAPYSFSWTTPEETGTYTLKAVATDNDDLTAESLISIEIQKKPVTNDLPYTEDFEAEPTEWTFKAAKDGWMYGTSSTLGSSSYWDFNGNSSKFMGANPDNAGENVNVTDWAISPVLNMAGQVNVILAFDYKLKRGSGSYRDEMVVYYRVNSGSWVELENLADANDWTNHSIELPTAALTEDVQIGFYFNDFNTWGYGGGFDNILIEGITFTPEPEISISTSSLNYGIVETGSAITKSFTITNEGTAQLNGNISVNSAGYTLTEAGKSVKAEHYRGEGRYSLTKASLAYTVEAGNAKTYNITFNPGLAGTFNGYVTISSNDSDEASNTINLSGKAETFNAPSNLATIVDDENVTISWNAPSSKAFQNYKLYRGNQVISTQTATSYIDTGLANGSYTYKVTAVYESGESTFSNTSTAVVDINVTVSLNEDFDSSNSVPTGWTILDEDGDANEFKILSNSSYSNSGNNCMYVKWNGSGNDDWLISPKTTAGTVLTFAAKSYHTSYLESMEVLVSTTAPDPANFTTVKTINNLPTSYNTYTADLSAYTGQEVYVALRCISVDKYYLFIDDIVMQNSKTLAAYETIIPEKTALVQNYPNPFNPETTIMYALNKDQQVSLVVYNNKGQMIKELINGNVKAGNHEVRFNAANLNSGVYYYRMKAGSNIFTKKMILIK